MSDQSNVEKEYSHYLGDVVGGLIREAAYWKARFNAISAENERLKFALQQNQMPTPNATPGD